MELQKRKKKVLMNIIFAKTVLWTESLNGILMEMSGLKVNLIDEVRDEKFT